MGYFWLAMTICWLSGLAFAWKVVALRHGRTLPPTHGHPLAPPEPPYGHPYPSAEEYEQLLEVLLRHPLPARPVGIDAPRPAETVRPREARARAGIDPELPSLSCEGSTRSERGPATKDAVRNAPKPDQVDTSRGRDLAPVEPLLA